jgi:predicted DCC family thiol-disulfide oxidoreductase YuxK
VDAPRREDLVFFDGTCGLCHHFVRFAIARDRDGRFHYAPLGGATFERLVLPEVRAALPDSVVVAPRAGGLLVRSDAALHVLRRLGGVYAGLAAVGGLVPRFVRDAVYDLVARFRRDLFAAPVMVCPVVPSALRDRFEP